VASRGSQRCRGAENPQNSRDLDTNKDYDTGGTAGKENACPGCVCVCVCVTHSRPGCEVTVCVCVSLVRVVIICLASTHTALVSSPSLAVLHLSTYLYLPTALQVLQVRKETLHRHEPVVSLCQEQESPTCAPDRPSKILLVQVGTLSSSPIPRLGLSVFFLSFFTRIKTLTADRYVLVLDVTGTPEEKGKTSV